MPVTDASPAPSRDRGPARGRGPARDGARGRPGAQKRRRLGSTYRLQLSGVGLAAATAAVPVLDLLGVETLYVSPIMQAAPGSTHGYDVVDATRIDPSLGTDEELAGLLDVLDRHDMGLLVDIVPNHMAASEQNRWWIDVLRLGEASPHARVFDIDWSAHHGRVLLPVLGQPLADALDAGEVRVVVEGGQPHIAYFDHRFPVDPASWPANRRQRLARRELVALLDRQHYRLACWRLARHQVNYRRFFDIDSLIGVRVEDDDVYQATHTKVLELARHPRLVGVRVDHVDGLADPAGYLGRLRRDLDRAAGDGPAPVVVVEKILQRSEPLPEQWPTEGTTGYEWVDLAGGMLLDGRGAEHLAAGQDFGALAVACRRSAVADLFPGLFGSLARAFTQLVEEDRPGADLDVVDVAAALTAVTAHLGVYRTYLRGGRPSTEDRRVVDAACAAAGDELEGDARRAAEMLRGLLLEPRPAPAITAWQQVTGAVAAKGVEDTALYRYQGCLAGAEVGGSPEDPAVAADQFHEQMVRRRQRWPGSLNALTTHDTKRSADVRARLAVLSEVPDQWDQALRRWSRWHRPLRHDGDPAAVDADEESFIYQTVVGAWPVDRAGWSGFGTRMRRYVHKALREAKVRTSWLSPDAAHEDAVDRFVRALLASSNSRFRSDVERLLEDIGPAACANALALVALQATTPGVPDVYQGTERWALTLVDPDNRAPVDLARLRRRLERLDDGPRGLASGWDGTWRDDTVKLWLTRELLRLRRQHSLLLDEGTYEPLAVRGRHARHVVAFTRRHRSSSLVVVVPRLSRTVAGPARLPVGRATWGQTTLQLPESSSGDWIALDGHAHSTSTGRIPLATLLDRLPVAILSTGSRG